MHKVMATLNFFRLIDEHGTLSLTNIAVIIVLGKVVVSEAVDLEGMAALIAAISAYNFKRWVMVKKEPVAEDKLKAIEEKINRIAFAAGLRKK
jgi:hypothetical protein